jgi:hypothetical protein
VLGGQPSPTPRTSADERPRAELCQRHVERHRRGGETGYGVTWILGGVRGSTSARTDGMELFSRSQAEQDVSIQAVEVTGSGYNAKHPARWPAAT